MLSAIFAVSCGGTKNERMETVTYRVNSFRVPCTGVAPMECLEIRRGDSDSWQLFYSEIEGFAFEPGYLYRIRVREEKLDPTQVPADGSSIKYTLVAVVEKIPDPKLRLNDIWMLQEMEGLELTDEVLGEYLNRPSIEFHLRDRRFMGSDGCNRFRGNLTSLGDRELQMGTAMSTKKSCGDMRLPDTFMKLLTRVDAYDLREGTLILSEGETELLHFRKTD